MVAKKSSSRLWESGAVARARPRGRLVCTEPRVYVTDGVDTSTIDDLVRTLPRRDFVSYQRAGMLVDTMVAFTTADETTRVAALVSRDEGPRPDHLRIKRYMGHGPTETLHVDRDRSTREPMKWTAILCLNDNGGTSFPFAIRDPRLVDEASTSTGRRVDASSLDSSSESEGWALPQDAWDRGLFVRAKRGRLILFETARDGAPLFESAHQGWVDGERFVITWGWNADVVETEGSHEMLERESFETRAHFFGRTLEEELVGAATTPFGPRRGEALAALAVRRNTSIERLLLDDLAQGDDAARSLHDTLAATPRGDVDVYRWATGVAGVAHARQEQVAAPPTPPAKVFWSQACPICMEDFSVVDKGQVEGAAPGATECGHVVCGDCHAQMRALLGISGGMGRCATCRKPAAHWMSLIVDGQWTVPVETLVGF